METSLHRQLKELYCGDAAGREVRVAGYRIDAIVDGTLVEIQQASLAALRDKIRTLLEAHEVLVVKPLSARKTILRRKRRGGQIIHKRLSPRHETVFELFTELVHFVRVFPHPKLTLEVLLTEQEEIRVPRKRRRYRGKDYTVEDRTLIAVTSRHSFRTAADLCLLLPGSLPDPFTTADIARLAEIPRWLAQKMAYCLRHTGGVEIAGKIGNSVLYARTRPRRAA